MKISLASFTAGIAILLLIGAGNAVDLLFPLLATVLATLLFARARHLYLDFILWVWFLSPFIRRVADFQTGWRDPSFILLTPYLVTLVAPVWQWRNLANRSLSNSLPFLIAMAAIGYGLVVGFALQPLNAVVAATPTWVTPVCFAWWYSTASVEDRRNVNVSLSRSLQFGLIAMGLYGLFQFVTVPAWDANWLKQLGSVADVSSMGIPAPFQLRVFSTLNSPGTFALISAAALLAVAGRKSLWAVPACTLGLITLALSQVRSAWLELMIGVVLLFISASWRSGKALLLGAAGSLILLPALLAPPVRSVIFERFESFASLRSDDSAAGRSQGFYDAVQLALAHPMGLGLGVPESVIADDGSFSLHDNGVAEAVVSLGPIAGSMFLVSLLMAAFGHLRPSSLRLAFGDSSAAISFSMLSLLPLGSLYLGPIGFILWLFMARAGYPAAAPDAQSRKLRNDPSARVIVHVAG